MILALDIGNTDLKAALFPPGGGPDADPLRHLRLPARGDLTRERLREALERFLREAGVGPSGLDGAIAATVRPSATDAVSLAVADATGRTPHFAGRETVPRLPSGEDYPAETGIDRLLNVVAAWEIHRGAVIAVDAGTAITFDLVTASGSYAGGIIAPGVNTSASALHRMTAALPEVEVERPASLVSKKTAEAMRSGLYWGFVSLIDGVIERMTEESGESPRCIATGGLSGLMARDSRFITDVDPYLTLKGLKIAYEVKHRDG